MRILCDTNVILDDLLRRLPWFTDARGLLIAHLSGRVEHHVTATTLTDIFYISRRHVGRERPLKAVKGCVERLRVVGVGIPEVRNAIHRNGKDFEGDLQVACATMQHLDGIVTRDVSGFQNCGLPVFLPEDLIRKLPEQVPEK